MGGRAYLEGDENGFARRWRESAIIPVLTPSVLQLQAAVDQAGLVMTPAHNFESEVRV
jgi:hypothetical protein